MKTRVSSDTMIVLIGSALYICLLGTFSILRHYSFITCGLDLGVFMQSLWTTANAEGFLYNTIEHQLHSSISQLGTHFQPILLFLVPIYKLFPKAETLLLLQVLSITMGGLILYKFAILILKDSKTALWIYMLYLFNPFIHGIIRFDFHPVSLAIPFIFLTAYYIELKRYKKAFISSFFVLLVKEDAGLALISLGMFYLLKDMQLKFMNKIKGVKKIPVITKFNHSDLFFIYLILSGVLWIIISIFILMPVFREGNVTYLFLEERYGKFVLEDLELRLAYIFLLGATTGFFPHLIVENIPLYFLPLLENVLSSRRYQYIIGFQYPYMLAPLLLISAIYSIKKLGMNYKTIKILSMSAIIFSLLTTPLSPPLGFEDYLGELKHISYKWEVVGFPNEHHKLLKSITTKLSKCDVSILAQNDIFPHLANRRNTYLFLDTANPPKLAIFDKNLTYYCIPKDGTWCIRVPYSNLTKLYTKVYEKDGIEIYVLNNLTGNRDVRECLNSLLGDEK